MKYGANTLISGSWRVVQKNAIHAKSLAVEHVAMNVISCEMSGDGLFSLEKGHIGSYCQASQQDPIVIAMR